MPCARGMEWQPLAKELSVAGWGIHLTSSYPPSKPLSSRLIVAALRQVLLTSVFVLVTCYAVALMPRNRARDATSIRYYDADNKLVWKTGRSRLIERWTKLMPVLDDDDWLIRLAPVDGEIGGVYFREPNGVIERSLRPAVIAQATWEHTRDYRRVLEWGWPWPVLSCSAQRGTTGWDLNDAIPGPGFPAAEDLVSSESSYGIHHPDGGVIPLRLHPMPLLADSMIVALFAVITRRGVQLCRSAFRRKRGLCCICGYHLAGLDPCPECGAAARRSQVAS
jgi:hypothetical protein